MASKLGQEVKIIKEGKNVLCTMKKKMIGGMALTPVRKTKFKGN